MRTKAASFSLIILMVVIVSFTGQMVVTAKAAATVYIGGFPVTVDINSNGAIVIDTTPDAQNFPYTLNRSLAIKKGDTIVEIDGNTVTCTEDIDNIMERNVKGSEMTVRYKRGDKYDVTTMFPVKEECSGKYKLGFCMKDKICGLGTVTFICPNKTVAALGHSIVDDETGVKVDCRSGSVFECKLTGIEKGKSGAPGRLKGSCVNCLYPKGEIYENADIGLYGKYTGKLPSRASYEVAPSSAVKAGGAKIYSTIEKEPKFYDIEIVRTFKQTSAESKGMVIRVTDSALLGRSGGIVQGMSGSPIVQNGKIVGAVTHVYTNDPAMGYAVYSEWMLNKADSIS